MSAILTPGPQQNKSKLLDQVRDVIRLKHYSIRTEQSYIDPRSGRQQRHHIQP